MAVTGVHFECHHAMPPATGGASSPVPMTLLWSENPASGVKTVNTVPVTDQSRGRAIVTAVALTDSWVATSISGVDPNPAANPRRLVPAGSRVDFAPVEGGTLAWVAA